MVIAHGWTMSASMDVSHSQNTAPVLEFRCLYTADIRRKQKRWQDGRLKFHTFNKRVMVYDEKSNFVGDTHWKGGLDFDEGEELELERGGILVEVGECIGQRDQDLSELVDKRVKDKQDRAAAKAAQTPSASSIRPPGTPGGSALLRPKTRNSILTPTGHYGRAVVPTTSPFEQRQATNRDENEPPTKRRKQNEITSSKNGYAQNLMGATLSLTSSKPSSTPTIRYEPFKARPLPQTRTDAIDLTLDDEEELKATEARRRVAKERRDAIERLPPRQKKLKRSPPVKSGYASNLTGTPLMLSRSEPRPPGRTMMAKASIQRPAHAEDGSATDFEESLTVSQRAPKRQSPKAKGAVQPRFPHVDQSSSEGEDSTIDNEPAPRKPRYTDRKPGSGQPRKQYMERSPSDDGRSIDIDPPSKAVIAKKLNISVQQPLEQVGQDSFTKQEDDLIELQSSHTTMSIKTSSKTKRPVATSRPTERDSPSPDELDHSGPTKFQEKQRAVPTTKVLMVPSANESFQSCSSSPARIESATPALQRAGSFKKSSAIQKLSATGQNPDRSMSALRIKSKTRQKMMMLMNRPSSRPSASNTSFDGSILAVKPSKKLIAPSNEIEMSQATINLNTFAEKQRVELEARLSRIGTKPHLGDISSSDPDSGIDHETIDLLLTRKPHKQAEQARQLSPKSYSVDKSPDTSAAGKKITARCEIDGPGLPKKIPTPLNAAHLSNYSPAVNRLSNPNVITPRPATVSQDIDQTSPSSQSRPESLVTLSVITVEGSKDLVAGKSSASTTDLEISGKESLPPTDVQRPPIEIEILGGTVTTDKSLEVLSNIVPEVLKESTIQVILTEGQSTSRLPEGRMRKLSSDSDEGANPPAINPPGQSKQLSPLSSPTIETFKSDGNAMQSSTSRFRAMINPSSGTRILPQRTAVPPIEPSIPPILTPSEDEPVSNEASVDSAPKSHPPVQEALKERPGPVSGLGFSAATTSAALNIPDLAGIDLKRGPSRAKLANPATRGKSLQTLAANTVDTISHMFNPMPPPASRISGRIERSLGRDESGIDGASNGPLREAPVGGPWSREAFDLFGIHGPPGMETGPGFTAT